MSIFSLRRHWEQISFKIQNEHEESFQLQEDLPAWTQCRSPAEHYRDAEGEDPGQAGGVWEEVRSQAAPGPHLSHTAGAEGGYSSVSQDTLGFLRR